MTSLKLIFLNFATFTDIFYFPSRWNFLLQNCVSIFWELKFKLIHFCIFITIKNIKSHLVLMELPAIANFLHSLQVGQNHLHFLLDNLKSILSGRIHTHIWSSINQYHYIYSLAISRRKTIRHSFIKTNFFIETFF